MGYEEQRYQTKQMMMVIDDKTLNGTIAAAAEFARVTAFQNIKVTDYNMNVRTGGTAAGPSFTINKSAAGTGALAAIGTATFGTIANNTNQDGTLTSTAFAAGDDIVLKSVAGTVASAPVFSFYLEYQENFVAG